MENSVRVLTIRELTGWSEREWEYLVSILPGQADSDHEIVRRIADAHSDPPSISTIQNIAQNFIQERIVERTIGGCYGHRLTKEGYSKMIWKLPGFAQYFEKNPEIKAGRLLRTANSVMAAELNRKGIRGKKQLREWLLELKEKAEEGLFSNE